MKLFLWTMAIGLPIALFGCCPVLEWLDDHVLAPAGLWLVGCSREEARRIIQWRQQKRRNQR